MHVGSLPATPLSEGPPDSRVVLLSDREPLSLDTAPGAASIGL